MEGYRESIRQHFGDMEEDYIKVKGELKKLRFEHRVLQGQSSQELERVSTLTSPPLSFHVAAASLFFTHTCVLGTVGVVFCSCG